jgi:hypothetical protein
MTRTSARPRIFFLIINGYGTRALGRTRDTVTEALRGIEALLWHINRDYLNTHKNAAIAVDLGMSKGG